MTIDNIVNSGNNTLEKVVDKKPNKLGFIKTATATLLFLVGSALGQGNLYNGYNTPNYRNQNIRFEYSNNNRDFLIHYRNNEDWLRFEDCRNVQLYSVDNFNGGIVVHIDNLNNTRWNRFPRIYSNRGIINNYRKNISDNFDGYFTIRFHNGQFEIDAGIHIGNERDYRGLRSIYPRARRNPFNLSPCRQIPPRIQYRRR